MHSTWQDLFAQRTRTIKSSAIRELLKLTEQPDVISFAGGLPAPDVFPIAEITEVTNDILSTSGPQALQYGTTEGYTPLRELVAQQLSSSGIDVKVPNILITSGSQQALDLLGKVFFNPGDTILVESPTYMGALQAWNPYEVNYVSAPMDEYGIIAGQVEQIIQQTHPKMIYVLPNFQNPTGVTMSLERRQQLIEISHRYGIPLIEDDPYGQLRFEGEAHPSLLQISACLSGKPELVFYMGSFSKVLAPGLRLGYIAAPTEVIAKLVQAKQGVDLNTPVLNQMIAYEMMKRGLLKHHIPKIRQAYREHRNVMLKALQQHFPPQVRWTHPEGGMFLWITLPESLDAESLLRETLNHKVAFVPGASFYAEGNIHNTLRLNFSNSSPERIEIGIARMGQVLQKQGLPV
jgi:2-aminoadipate transaminase